MGFADKIGKERSGGKRELQDGKYLVEITGIKKEVEEVEDEERESFVVELTVIKTPVDGEYAKNWNLKWYFNEARSWEIERFEDLCSAVGIPVAQVVSSRETRKKLIGKTVWVDISYKISKSGKRFRNIYVADEQSGSEKKSETKLINKDDIMVQAKAMGFKDDFITEFKKLPDGKRTLGTLNELFNKFVAKNNAVLDDDIDFNDDDILDDDE